MERTAETLLGIGQLSRKGRNAMKAAPLLAHARDQLLPCAADTSVVAAAVLGPRCKIILVALRCLGNEDKITMEETADW